MKNQTSPSELVGKLIALLRPERKDIYLIYLYGIFISLINLSLPLGIQAVVTRISGGVIYDSIYVLIGLVVLAITLSGILRILQVTLVEVVQRRIFARTALRFSQVFLRYDLSKAAQVFMPEKANRFFDVLTIQKGLPKLLGDLSAALFQIFFSLIVLTLYHPYFIFLVVLILGFFVLGFWFTAPKGVHTSVEESTFKYKVAYWLEELARTPRLLRPLTEAPLMDATDSFTYNYLKNRQQHFRVLLSHYSWILGLEILVIGGLLFMGAFLVANRLINLGQFIASELILILLISAVEKVIFYLDVVYDLITASFKMSKVTDMPEDPSGMVSGIYPDRSTHSISLHLAGPAGLETYNIKPGEVTLVEVTSRLESDQVIDALMGGQAQNQFMVTIDDIPIHNLNLDEWRRQVRVFSGAEDILAGTLETNLQMQGLTDATEIVLQACRALGIFVEVFGRPDAMKTEVLPRGYNLDGRLAELYPLALALAARPTVLIWNDTLQFVGQEEKEALYGIIADFSPGLAQVDIVPKKPAPKPKNSQPARANRKRAE